MPVKPGSMVDMQDFQQYMEYDRFQTYPTALNSTSLAIATEKYLLLTAVPQQPHDGGAGTRQPSTGSFLDYHHPHSYSPYGGAGGGGVGGNQNQDDEYLLRNRLVLEYKETSYKPSVLTWIDETLLCIGFEHGLLLCFDIEGNEVFQFKGSNTYVQSIKVTEEQGNFSLWVLYEDKLLVMIPLADALAGKFCDAYGFQLNGQEACHDFVVYPCPYAGRNEWEDFDIDTTNSSSGNGLRLFVAGFNNAICIYDLDMKKVRKEFKRNMSQDSKDKSSGSTTSSITKSFFSLVSAMSGMSNDSSTSSKKKDVDISQWNRSSRCMTISPKLSFLDGKRRILRISMDPFKSLIACADTLGRVTLFDIRNESMIRIWKGLRDAYLGWYIDNNNSNNHSAGGDQPGRTLSRSSRSSSRSGFEDPQQGGGPIDVASLFDIQKYNVEHLKLVIFAPLLGLASIYQMRNGPCIRVVPVGMNSRLTSMLSFSSQQNPIGFFNILPIRCEADSKCLEILSLNNQEDTAAVENELAMIVDMMEEEVEQQARTGTLHQTTNEESGGVEDGNDPATTLDFNQEDENVRHTDMIHSIQEAIEQGKKHRQQDSYLIEEMKRLLRVFRMSNIDNRHAHATAAAPAGSSSSSAISNLDNVMTKTESRLVGILQQCSLKSFTRYLAIIEQSELNGFPLESGLELHREAYSQSMYHHQSHHHLYGYKKSVLPWLKLCGKRFSIEFHRQINEVIRQRITAITTDASSSNEQKNSASSSSSTLPDQVIHALRIELDARANLLKSFELFVKSNRHYFSELRYSLTHTGSGFDSDSAGPQTSLSPFGGGIGVGITALSDDPTVLCRQNNHRAEALCWTLRSIRKVDETYGVPVMAGGNAGAGSRPGTAPNSPMSMMINSPLSPNRKASNIIPTYRTDSIVLLSDPKKPIASPMLGSGSANSGSTIGVDGMAIPRVEGKHSVVHNLSPLVASANHSPVPSAADRFKGPANNKPQQRNRVDSSLANDVSLAFSGVEYVNFSMFRSFHYACQDPDGEFSYFPRLDDLRRLLDQSRVANGGNDEGDASPTPSSNAIIATLPSTHNLSSIDAMFAYKQAHPNQLKSLDITAVSHTHDSGVVGGASSSSGVGVDYYVQPSVSTEFMSFFFRSLTGDLECFKSFTSALKYEGSFLSGPLGLKTLMPGFYAYLSQHSLKALVSDLLSRKVSTSPFQRWVRDHLLEFQDMVSSYNAYLRTKIQQLQQKSAKTVTQSMIEEIEALPASEEEIDLFVFHTMTKIRKEYLTHRCKGEEEVDNTLLTAIPSFDEYVRHLLRPILLDCRKDCHLEQVLGFAAVLLETLSGVHEQIERRTYGADHLKTTLATWELIIKQIRVVLFLKNRVYRDQPSASLFTIDSIHDGRLSLHKILAMDTLEFALRANVAIEHEVRCKEVYMKRKQSQQVSASQAQQSQQPQQDDQSAAKSDVLLAWGPVADKRWRDILGVAITEDTADHQTQQNSLDSSTAMKATPPDTAPAKKLAKRRRKPLLLFFPEHNQSVFLGCYRCLLLADRWWKKVDSMELLAVMCEHLYELAAEWRGVIALELYKVYLFPILQIILSMEEENSTNTTTLLFLPSGTGSSLVGGASSSEKTGSANTNNNVNLRNQILNIMSDANLLKSFVILAIEVLNYTLEVVPQQGKKYDGEIMDMSSLPWQEMLNAMGIDSNSSSNNGNAAPTIADYRDSIDSLQMLERMNLFPRTISTSSSTSASEYPSNTTASAATPTNSSSTTTWPFLIDKKLVDMFVNFYKPHFRLDDATNNSREALLINQSASRELILYHMTILYVMQLRFQCGLRGVKPSQLLGTLPLRDIINGTIYGMQSDIIADDIDGKWRKVRLNESQEEQLIKLRSEFLARCFCRLVLIESMPQALYNLGSSLWSYEMDVLRLLHVYALVENGDRDNEIEELVPKFNDMNLPVDMLISIARQRLGNMMIQIEKIPSYGPMLAAMDAEALQWVKHFPKNLQSALMNSGETGGSGGMSGSGPNSPAGGNVVTTKSKSSGNSSSGAVVQFDISSTRRIIIFLQSLLIDVPTREREIETLIDTNSLSHRVISYLMSFTRYHTWVERKSRCDALLSLCNSMVPLSAARKKTSSSSGSSESSKVRSTA